MAHAQIDRDWDKKYETGDTPWDSNLPSKELQVVLHEYAVRPGTAIELGCGTGTNAVFLAQQGWDVTAVDCSALALSVARQRADRADVQVRWIEADVQNYTDAEAPFDLVFDRGCYHCCRRVDLPGYLSTLRNITRPGSHMLCLCGNANDGSQYGPPRVQEAEIREELGAVFEIEHLLEFHFEDAGGVQGPLGWSVWMSRPASS